MASQTASTEFLGPESYLRKVLVQTLDSKKDEIDSARDEATKAVQKFKTLVIEECGKSSLVSPQGFDETERALAGIDIDKAWKVHRQERLKEVEEFEAWRKDPRPQLNKTSTNLPSKPKFHTLTDQDLANATALALKAKKHDLDSAAAAVLKSFRGFKSLVTKEYSRSYRTTPAFLDALEEGIKAINLDKSWIGHRDYMMLSQKDREVDDADRRLMIQLKKNIANRLAPDQKLTFEKKLENTLQEFEGLSITYPAVIPTSQVKKHLSKVRQVGSLVYKEHQYRTKLREPLVQVGVATRRRFLEMSKRWERIVDGVVLRGNPDEALIRVGNKAAHCGNALADLSLFNLGHVKDEEKTEVWEIFEAFYSLRSDVAHNLSLHTKWNEISNMRATLVGSKAWSPFTFDKRAEDRFMVLLKRCESKRDSYVSNKTTWEREGMAAFDQDVEVERYCVEMRTIVENFNSKARKGR